MHTQACPLGHPGDIGCIGSIVYRAQSPEAAPQSKKGLPFGKPFFQWMREAYACMRRRATVPIRPKPANNMA
jgi:hypothetical protein